MIDANSDALKRAEEYARRRGLTLKAALGSGVDGVVLSTDVATAVKSLKYKPLYRQEDWLESRRELFEDRWPQAKDILHEFRKHGIYLVDLKPGNIVFE